MLCATPVYLYGSAIAGGLGASARSSLGHSDRGGAAADALCLCQRRPVRLVRQPGDPGQSAAARADRRHGTAGSRLFQPRHPRTAAPAARPTREQAVTALLLEEIEHADTQALGVPLPDPVSGDKRLRTLCEAMLHAPTTRSTLADWARDTGASERTMARLFREELGMSYPQWRQQVVLAHALPLLARGLPISQVAAASGYASDSAFTAMFKAAMGQPPSAFRI
jgi:AraC-like DNA-binding protein